MPRCLPLCLLASLLLVTAPILRAAEPEVDLRVLIDVSGSMKNNDPSNLRAPALRLLVGLLPDGAHAGVWSFGEYINELVPLGTVNEIWKKLGLQASHRIGSRELFTNIEQGLVRATSGWKQAQDGVRRNVILLTDGLVDVDKDPALNRESRRRVLEELLPQLRDAGVVLHAVALSDNADHELLQALAMGTDGAYEYADSAERLNRVFARLFTKSAPADSVPLRDNHFDIDDSIEDMTLLVFSAPDTKPLRVVAPDGSGFGQGDAPANVHWVHEQGYDLVTVEKPVAGTWQLETPQDPDNRVLVVTNLTMRAGALPNNLLKDDRLQLSVWLEEEGERLQRPDFLKLVRFEALEETDGRPVFFSLTDDGAGADATAGDGVFSADLGDLTRTGAYRFLLAAEGGSFKREIRYELQVHDSPVDISLEPAPADAAGFALRVQARKDLVDLGSVLVEARLSGDTRVDPTVPTIDDALWGLDIAAAPADRSVQLRVQGRMVSGRLFKVEIERLLPGTAPQEPPAPPPVPVPVPQVTTDEPVDWLQVGLLIGVTNLVLIPLLVFGYLFWKKKRDAVLEAEHEAMEL